MEAMRHEHCTRAGCDKPFVTDNYKLSTTPKEEWAMVVEGADCKPEHMAHDRIVRTYATCLTGGKSKEVIEEAKLGEVEVVATILYTGPMVNFRFPCFRVF
mmetsp:Transcript_6162/g.19809  ORF Transcript_6162/g.19809 Transcript_6162/m.19809 type:complete len:101 (+) Transcript_6162:765-1067(+)